MDEDQRGDIDAHCAEVFPASIDKGELYGGVELVMADSDIVGWASQGRLDPAQRRSLQELADQLARAVPLLPPDAQPYFTRLLRIARRAAAASA